MDVAYRRLLGSMVGPPRGTMAWNYPHLEWPCSGLHLADWIQIMVGNLPATPLEFGTVFRNTTWASMDQESFIVLASTGGAQTHWPPKILLGYFDYKFLPLEEFTFMGDRCNWCCIVPCKPAWIFGVLQALMYIGKTFTISSVPETGCAMGHTGLTLTLTFFI